MINKSVTLNLKVSNYGSRVLGIIKEKYSLHNKSEALNKFIEMYGVDFLEREVKEEVVNDMIKEVSKMKKEKKKEVSFSDLDKLCGIE